MPSTEKGWQLSNTPLSPLVRPCRCASTPILALGSPWDFQICGGSSASSMILMPRPHAKQELLLINGSVVVPAILLASLNAKNLWDEHWEHWEHMPPLEDRVEYPYMNIRTKAFPWGDGDKVGYLRSIISADHGGTDKSGLDRRYCKHRTHEI